MNAATPSPEPMRYADALAELETVLAELEAEDVDVDGLTARVRRAAELIELCRARVHGAQLEIEEAVAALDADGPPR